MGKKGFMIIKIDLEKADDCVRWDFLTKCLQEMALPQNMIDIIINCVSSINLGKYLGVALHHKRVDKTMFQEIVDKVTAQLSSWKANLLSLGGRTTLISSITFAILGCIMQVAHLPASMCEVLDKHNRTFLWGKTGDRGKLGWSLVKKKDEFWVRVIRSKYKCGDDLILKIYVKRPGSNIWSTIEAMWETVKTGLEDTGSGRCMRSIRGSDGNFIIGFIHRLDGRDNLTAELWACVHGLKTTWDTVYQHVILESDS
ncbi:uncharacterized protein LOC129286191 [Prosopis cineraria]|uniref:uncharacterized protein LOC129286191 n=1 Tax=Prosopis cineraria TaxID=364024 RepID=UPI00240F780E|nr:uncharacterized protein LOC129286191 [Prosopis cineraria]